MDTAPVPSHTPVVVARPARPFVPYTPAISERLRVLLLVVFGLFAFLGATGVYLGAVSLLNYARSPQSYTTPFSLWIFLLHIVVGVVGTLPFLVFGFAHWLTARSRLVRRGKRLVNAEATLQNAQGEWVARITTNLIATAAQEIGSQEVRSSG